MSTRFSISLIALASLLAVTVRGDNLRASKQGNKSLPKKQMKSLIDSVDSAASRDLQSFCPSLPSSQYTGTGSTTSGTVSVLNPVSASDVQISYTCQNNSCDLEAMLMISNGGPMIKGRVASSGSLSGSSGQFTINKGTGDFAGASGSIQITNFVVAGQDVSFTAAVAPCLPFPFPTRSYTVTELGKKCPYQSSKRLFRTADNSPLTVDQCAKKCKDTPTCEYFTLGEGADLRRPSYEGVCMGCTGDATLQNDTGFDTYEVKYGLVQSSKKCPYQSSNRLFRTADNSPLTVDECFNLCKDYPTCEYFTLGEGPNLRSQGYKGVCMGCTADSTLQTDPGFNSYEVFA